MALPTGFATDTREEAETLIALVGKTETFLVWESLEGFKNYTVFPNFGGELSDIPIVEQRFTEVQQLIAGMRRLNADGNTASTTRQTEVNSTTEG